MGFDWNLIKSINEYQKYVTQEQRIGKGTYGVVYKGYAINGKEKEYIAIKKVELDDNEYEAQASALEKENNFLKSTKNSNIMKVLFHFSDITDMEKRYYVGMEFGLSNLDSIIKHKCQFSESEAAALAQQIWNGLNYLQLCNTAHRDLKPENIIMTQDGVFKLCDFGEVKFANQTFQTRVQSPYLAPELYNAFVTKQKLTQYNPAKADTFSYGVLILQAILGCPQIGIQGINVDEKMIKDTLNSCCSESFKWFLSKCLNFDPSQRFTFKQMKDIFDLNPIDAYFKLEKKDEQIKKLTDQLYEYQTQIEKQNSNIDQLSKQVKELTAQLKTFEKQDLTNESQGVQYQQIENQMKNYTIEKFEQNKVAQIQSIVKKTQKELEELFKNNQNTWKNQSESQVKEQIKKNSGFNAYHLSEYYYWNYDWQWQFFGYDASFQYGFGYLSDRDGSYPFFRDENQTNAAVELINKLERESGYSKDICLRFLYSNQWNYSKSLSDLIN